VYLVAEVLTWVLVGAVYLLQADLMAWEYLLRVVRAELALPSAVERAASAYPPEVRRPPWAYPSVEQMGWEYQLQQAFLRSSVKPLPWQQEWG
jgi:hypothetical protein